MAYIKNPNYNPNDPNSLRYIMGADPINTSPTATTPTNIPAPAAAPTAPAPTIVNPLPPALANVNNTTTALKTSTPSPTNTPAMIPPAPVKNPALTPSPVLNTQQQQSITNLVNSGRAFNETDARNYAYATTGSAENFKQFLGKTGAQIKGATSPIAPLNTSAPVSQPNNSSGAPVGAPPTAAAPYTPPASTGNEVTDKSLQDLAVEAGKAGMKLEDYLKLVTASSEIDKEQSDAIRNKLGIPDLVDKTFGQPKETTVAKYRELYDLSGLNDVKAKVKEIDDSIAKKRADLVTATGELLNNPWISQGTRQGRLANLQTLAFADMQNDIDNRKAYLEQYDKGIGEIEEAIKRSVFDQGEEQDLNIDKLNYLLTEAERDETFVKRTAEKRGLRYVPDYLKSIPGETADGFTLSEGETRYDAGGNVIASVDKSTKDKLVDINGTKYVDNGDGTYSLPNIPANPAQIQSIDDKINLVDEILNSPGLGGAVGTYKLGRWTPFNPDAAVRADFAAGVNQLVDQETLNTLLQLKAQGGTLGAISGQELNILQNAAAKFKTWEIKEDGQPTGRFAVSEELFKKELQRIKDSSTRLRAALTGESAAPQTLDQYYKTVDDNARAKIDQIIKENPNLSDDDIMSALGFKNESQTSKNGSLSPLAASIVQQESGANGGNYKAVGEVPAGYKEEDKALGRYQIVPKYHFSKIGLPNTPAGRQQFLNSPVLQDKLFNIIIDGLNKQYQGDPRKVAAAYYGGAGGASKVGTKAGDQPQRAGGKVYPSINQYVNSVVSRLPRTA